VSETAAPAVCSDGVVVAAGTAALLTDAVMLPLWLAFNGAVDALMSDSSHQ
jgi:hypothetical protein